MWGLLHPHLKNNTEKPVRYNTEKYKLKRKYYLYIVYIPQKKDKKSEKTFKSPNIQLFNHPTFSVKKTHYIINNSSILYSLCTIQKKWGLLHPHLKNNTAKNQCI